MPALNIPGLTFEVIDAHNQTAKFDLNIVVQPRAEQRTGAVSAALNGEIAVLTEYNADVFKAETVRRMLDNFRAILVAAITEPDRPVGAFLPGLGEVRADVARQPESAAEWNTPLGARETDGTDLLDMPESYWETEYVAPRTPIEAKLAEIWSECLQIDQVGVADEFFDLGGHSLLANQMMSRVQQEFNVEIPLRGLFEAPTVAELALVVVEAQAGQLDGDELAAFVAELER